MAHVFARLADENLRIDPSAVNNGRTDDVSFYVNGSNVSVHRWTAPLPKDRQIAELNWFLKGREYELITEEN